MLIVSSFATDTAQFLQSNGFGTIGENIFVNVAPQNILNKSIIVVYDIQSYRPIQPIHHIEESSISIQTYSNDNFYNFNTLNNIIYSLIDSNITINCNRYLGIYCETTPNIVKLNDKTGQLIYSTTLRCLRTNKSNLIQLEITSSSIIECNITIA